MGVYMPPPRDSDTDSGSNSGASGTNGGTNGGSNNATNGSKGNRNHGSSSTIIITIPHNPSVGLIWGPFTPSSDNLPALYGMTGLQFLLGLYGFRKLRRLYKPLPLPGSMIAQKGSLLKALIPFTLASVAVFGSGLELGRLCLSYDPWYEEAKHYRRVAIKAGDHPSAWFGAYKYYIPMDFDTWSNKVISYVKNIDEQMSKTGLTRAHSPILAKLNKDQKYSEIYNKIHLSNLQRFSSLLENDLKDINESNRAERMELIVEGKSPLVNPNYAKPHIHLDKFSIETEEQFDIAWSSFDPWDELKFETDYDIRLIPRWRWGKDDSHVDQSNGANQGSETGQIAADSAPQTLVE